MHSIGVLPAFYGNTIYLICQNMLLGYKSDIDDIANEIEKVHKNVGNVK